MTTSRTAAWRTLARRTLLSREPWLTVEEHSVGLPDGRIVPDWTWVKVPDYVNVVAVTAGGAFLCFRQVKYGVVGTTLGIVGGYVEPGEEPGEAARRELLEETGHEASAWTRLGEYRVCPNRGFCMAHLYLARGARRVAPVRVDDLEELRLTKLSRRRVEAALDRGEFKVLPWAAALALALRRLGGEGAAGRPRRRKVLHHRRDRLH